MITAFDSVWELRLFLYRYVALRDLWVATNVKLQPEPPARAQWSSALTVRSFVVFILGAMNGIRLELHDNLIALLAWHNDEKHVDLFVPLLERHRIVYRYDSLPNALSLGGMCVAELTKRFESVSELRAWAEEKDMAWTLPINGPDGPVAHIALLMCEHADRMQRIDDMRYHLGLHNVSPQPRDF